jgi:hypothetical protein
VLVTVDGDHAAADRSTSAADRGLSRSVQNPTDSPSNNVSIDLIRITLFFFLCSTTHIRRELPCS